MSSMRIGVKKFYYSLITINESGTEEYATPVRIQGVNTININPNSSSATYYAEDQAWETATTIGQIDVEINLAELTLADQAILLGQTKSGAIYTAGGDDNAPYLAIGFESLKSDGNIRYTWLYKGKFRVPENNNETKGESVNLQPDVLMGTFISRILDGQYRKAADSGDADYTASIGSTWFDAVDSDDSTAPTISSTVPTDGASGVAVDTTVVINFSEAIAESTMTSDNFFMFKDSDGSAVAGTLTIDSDKDQVTFTPSSNLSGTTDYTFIVTTAVTDVFGNKLASAEVVNFTTV